MPSVMRHLVSGTWEGVSGVLQRLSWEKRLEESDVCRWDEVNISSSRCY